MHWNPFQYYFVGLSYTHTRILLVVDSYTYLNHFIDMTQNSYFGFQIWNLDLNPTYNRYNFTILLLWCYNLLPYDPLSWTLPTLNTIPHYRHTHNTISYSRLCPFHASFRLIFFLCIWCQQEPIVPTAHVQNFKTPIFSIPALQSNVSSQEDIIKYLVVSPDKLYASIYKLHSNYAKSLEKFISGTTKSWDIIQTALDSIAGTHTKLQFQNFQKQPKVVYRYDLSIFRSTFFNF